MSQIAPANDAASESGIAAGSSSTASAGSLPVQMPGRSYYKYRSSAPAQPKDGIATSMSLTQSSIDIREGKSVQLSFADYVC